MKMEGHALSCPKHLGADSARRPLLRMFGASSLAVCAARDDRSRGIYVRLNIYRKPLKVGV
jgi:hypothetical protein